MALTKQLAVGRLAKNSDGEFVKEKHILIASLLADRNDTLKATYNDNLVAIMRRGKDIPDTRMKLVSNDKLYEIHVLAHNIVNTRIVFFAVTGPKFGQSFEPSDLMREFIDDFLALHTENAVCTGKPAKLQKASIETLGELLKKYAVSKIEKVQGKVNEVTQIMQDSIEQALQNTDTINDMELKSDELLAHAGQFKKKAHVVKQNERCKYYKINATCGLITVVVITILLIIIICGAGAC